MDSPEKFLLYEHLNVTNASRPIYLAHLSFVTNPLEDPCLKVNDLPDFEKCHFVIETESCHEHIQYLNYLVFLYCSVNPSDSKVAYYLGIILLILLCIYMFTILGTTADRFFCPALAVMSNVMGLSENLAGVTLLAFGNGSTDIFTALANYRGDTEMLFSELFGGALFIIGTVSAIIMIIKPFSVDHRSFVRDLLFFLLGCSWIYYAFRDERITLFEANGTVVIYIAYLIIVIAQHIHAKKKIKECSEANTESSSIELNNLIKQNEFRMRKNSKEFTDYVGTARSSFQAVSKNDKIFDQFLRSINPIDPEEWNDKLIHKIFCVIKAPYIFILLFFIPIVDYTIENHGWSKLLNCLQVIILPIAIIMKTDASMSILISIFFVSMVISIIVFFTSRTDHPPKYHLGFAIFGSFVGSMALISFLAAEVVAVLATLGIVWNLSESVLGLSILAWGNSIGDLISNISLARQGYTKMGFAACFGGPMFNTFLGMGVILNLKILFSEHRSEGVFAREGAMGPNCTVFLSMLLSFTLIAFSISNYQARRSIGIYMFMIYLTFVLFCTLSEFEIIHSYGTDHRNEGEFIS